MKPIRVLLADDHTIVRAGIRGLLQGFGGIEIVAEALAGPMALELIQTHQPDVSLIHVLIPSWNGLEVALRAAKEWPHVRVVILSMHAKEEYVTLALRAGVAGYLMTNAAVGELEVAVRAAARGETYLCPAVAKQVIADYLHSTGGPHNSLQLLTRRQREILQLAAAGHSSKEISRTLQITVKTVENHRTQMMERLNIHDLASLTRFAIRVGLVNTDS